MHILYSLFILMLLGALCLLFLPIRSIGTSVTLPLRSYRNRNSLVVFIMIAFSFSTYLFLTNITALAQWINHGQQHYQLLVDYNQLGGIDGIIAKIKQRLAQNPSDQRGRIILEKLYRLRS